MVDAQFFIKGEEHPEFAPEKWDEIPIVAKFEKGNVQASLSDGTTIGASSITLHGEGAKRVISHLNGGLDLSTGGAFEGIPYDWKIKDGATELTLEYYIALTKPHKIFDETHGVKVECQIVKRKSLDWLSEKAGAISFAYLYDIKELLDSVIYFVEYMTERKLDGFRLFLIAYTFVFVIEAIKQMIYELNEWVAKVLGVLPVIEALLVLFQILLKHITTVVVIIALVKDVFDKIINKPRKHNGAYLRDLLTIASSHLGLNFKSTIFEGDYKWAYLLPSKSDRGYLGASDEENKGYPGVNSPVYKFDSLLRVLSDIYNARIRIVGDTLQFERRDFWQSMTNYTLPFVRLPAYSLNTGELYSNYVIRWTKDTSDLNTLEDADVLNYQSTTEPKIKVEKDLNLLTGIVEKTIPLGFGFRKDELNGFEKAWNIITFPFIALANGFLKVIHEVRSLGAKMTKFVKKLGKILKFVGIKINPDKGTDPGDPDPLTIETVKNKRIGTLKLSDDTFANDKLFLMRDGKVLPASRELFSPEYLYYNYHEINSFDPKNNNQGEIYQGVEAPFFLKDLVSLIDFNRFRTSDGKEGDMLEIRWKFKSSKANLDFILYDTFTNNFRNVEPERKITQAPEDEGSSKFHGPGYSYEHD